MTFRRLGLTVAAAVSAIALALAVPAAASADPIPLDGHIIIGDAQWQIDEYGLAYGWDAADVYDGAGYIYYPDEFYIGDYVYCGDDYTDAILTNEANGDITVVCPAIDWNSTGLLASVTFRFYAGDANGYLMRELLTVTNPTGATITPTPIENCFYLDYYTGDQGAPPFTTSSGNTDIQSDDTWYTTAESDGTSVVETNAWALTGSAATNGISMATGTDVPCASFAAGDSVFAPGETKYFASFTHMVIPTAVTPEAATTALTLAQTQTDEFASFSGRLIVGLPEGITVIGWGATPAAPALASTGSNPLGTSLLAVSTAGILALAGGLLLSSARSRSRVSSR